MTVLIALLLLAAVVGGCVLILVSIAVGHVVKEQVDALALACSMDAETLRAKIDDGMTAQEVAAEHGVDAERVIQQSMHESRHPWVAFVSRRTNWSQILN